MTRMLHLLHTAPKALLGAMGLIAVAFTASPTMAQNKPKNSSVVSTSTESNKFTRWQESCDAGDAESCFELGLAYYDGDGVPEDKAQSVAYFKAACDVGSGTACFNVGLSYAKGEGVDKDEVAAATCFYLGCEGGDVPFMYSNSVTLSRGFWARVMASLIPPQPISPVPWQSPWSQMSTFAPAAPTHTSAPNKRRVWGRGSNHHRQTPRGYAPD